MKRVKTETLLLVVTLMFISFCIGFFLGKGQGGDTITITRSGGDALQSTTATTNLQTTLPASEPTETPSDATVAPSESADSCVNINTATKEELMTLPGIGEVIAERIIAYRQTYGSFSSVEELDAVSGIGDKRLDAIRDYITVEERDEDSGS